MYVLIKKIKELDSTLHSNNTSVGYIKTGYAPSPPEINHRFCVNRFSTSGVVEIIDDHTFKTYSSIY